MAIVKGAGMVMKAVIEVSQWKSYISFSLLFEFNALCGEPQFQPQGDILPRGLPYPQPPPPSTPPSQNAESDVRCKNGWLHRKGGSVGGRESGEWNSHCSAWRMHVDVILHAQGTYTVWNQWPVVQVSLFRRRGWGGTSKGVAFEFFSNFFCQIPILGTGK